jgi:outer membrane receptor protein involved in Fe transport
LNWSLSENLDVGLRLENLGDVHYREHGSGIDAPGRNIGAWLSVGF